MSIKRVLVNAYTHLNLGDDLFLKILFERYPEVEFTLLTDEHYDDKVFKRTNLSFLTYPPIAINKYLKKVWGKFFKISLLHYEFEAKKKFLAPYKNQFDATITIGGSIFMEKLEPSFYHLNTHQLLADVFSTIPKFIIGSNFGPYKNEGFVDYYRQLFSQYTDVSFRDLYSKNVFQGLDNVRCNPDVVFSADFKPVFKEPRSVGFSIMDLTQRTGLSQYATNYTDLIVGLIHHYSQKGYACYLYSFCKYEGDERAANQVLALLNEGAKNNTHVVKYTGDIEGFLNEFSKVEIMYPTRFHAMILSMMFQQKIHPLLYSKKMGDVIEDLQCELTYTDLTSIDQTPEIGDMTNQESFMLPDGIKPAASKHFDILQQYLT
jgi:colanic acid/amylovoran biosynthesis protein